MTRQLPLPLPVRPALGRGDFFVAPANVQALAQIDDWQNWPGQKLLVCGPLGAGKTHLAHVWANDSAAPIVSAEALPDADIPALASGHICVEDIHAIAGHDAAERALFHLHNLVLANGHALLLTANAPPARWPLALADLKSRMMGAQMVMIEAPDDDLLAVVLAKIFADHQIVPSAPVIPYLVRHMPRSFGMARRIVRALDAAAMASGSAITRALAIDVLAHETDPAVTSLSHQGPTDAS